MTSFNKLAADDKLNVLAAMDKLNTLIKEEKHYDEMPNQQQSFQNFDSLGRDNSDHTNKTFEQLKAEYYANPQAFDSRKSGRSNGRGSMQSSKGGSMKKGRYVDDDPIVYDEASRRDRSANKRGTIVDRLYDLEARKREKLAAKQFQRYKEELSALKPKPDISLNSRIMAENKQKIPIYERSYVTMKQKEERINRMRAELEQQREEQDLANNTYTYKPNTSFSKSYISYDRPRTPEEFAAQVYAWQHKRNENLQREQYDALTDELSKLTFKPKINTRSKFLVEKNQYNLETVEDRLNRCKEFNLEKRKRMAEENLPTFRPVLNERSKHIMRLKRGDDGGRSRDLSANNSYMDASQDYGRKGGKAGGRSLTPNAGRNRQVPYYGPKSPKFNEIEYTPAIDFLLKKLK